MSDTWWTILFSAATGVICALLASWYAHRLSNPKRELRYSFIRNNSLLSTSENTSTSLEVLHAQAILTKPRIVDFEFKNPSSKPITADSFHGGSPIKFKLDADVVEVLSVRSEPGSAPVPTWTNTRTEIHIQPSLIKGLQRVTFSILVDGSAQNLGFESPLTDVEDAEDKYLSVREQILNQNRRISRLRLGVLACASLAIMMIMMTFVALVFKAEDLRIDKKLICESRAVEVEIKEKICPKD